MLADGHGDLALELSDLRVERLDHRDQRAHEFSAGAELELADPGLGSAAELCQKPRGLLAAGISLARQERLKALLAQPACVRGAGVALKERERDLTVQAREQPQRTGPKPRQLGAQLVDQRGPGADQILACSGDVGLALLLLSSLVVKQSSLAGNYLDS